MEKYLILIAGLPGTGKTETAKILYRFLEEYEIVSQNDIRRKMGMKKMPKTQEEVLRKIDIKTAELLRKNKGVIIDSVNRYLFRRHQLYGIASCCGKRVLTLECVCSESEAKKRIKSRQVKNGDKLIKDPRDTHIYDKLSELWEPILNDFKYPGEDHVSYLMYNTEKNQINKKIIRKNMCKFLDEIEKVLIK